MDNSVDNKYLKPVTRWRALASKVIVVAVAGSVGDWCVYINDVPGEDHDVEWQAVARNGDKLVKQVACALFPDFDPQMYRTL